MSNCLVQSRTYAPTGNRDLERDFLSQDLLSGLAIAVAIRSFDPLNQSLDRSYITFRDLLSPSLSVQLIASYSVA